MASNFFSQQDLARRNTRILVVLFALAVLLLLTLTNLLVAVVFGFADSEAIQSGLRRGFFQPELLLWTSLIVLGAIGIAMLLKWQQLRKGGRVVAEALGGQRVSPDTTDARHRQLLNVVEEMALAANLPVPAVYVLPESGINAFAAGYSPADAVIGVTQGCLEQLSRDELQGVIAHEFSHILNGDMRMNIKMIAVLNGILFVGHVGYLLLRGSRGAHIAARSSRNNKGGGGAAAILLLGLGFTILGYLGAFFGNLIKSAVSRQREYLADASAVQFTRNPAGIAGALKQIAASSRGTKISNQNADENSHLFFGEAISRWASIFATHPPLTDRIKRLEPRWNGKLPVARSTEANQVTADSTASGTADERQAETPGQRLLAALPVLLLQTAHQPLQAEPLLLALLISNDEVSRPKQLQVIRDQGSIALLQDVDRLLSQIEPLPERQKLMLAQLCIPSLKTLTAVRFERFEQLLLQVIHADGELHLLEWAIAQLVDHAVASQFRSSEVVRHTSVSKFADIRAEALQLLSLVANATSDDSASCQQSWQAGLSSWQLPDDTAQPDASYTAVQALLPKLMAASPKVKEKLWQGMQAAAQSDGQLSEQQDVQLRALSLLLEIPYSDEAIAN
ncbi:M48 family metallopeptidase [Alkalimonas sp.]|uniref:M48 family metallopeptidase n=1 Tax=Alkalimonas sp. TaxID=1872453 RepID=UPI00263AA50E|nr:M48 family metallopeptidase [Alkalimonas sp.]MCC5827133.1 M48 family metallopeptidase [Alkalimonas sp.]